MRQLPNRVECFPKLYNLIPDYALEKIKFFFSRVRRAQPSRDLRLFLPREKSGRPLSAVFFSDGSTELAEVSRRAREAAWDIFFALNFKFEISDLKSLNRGTRSRESTREILHRIDVASLLRT